MRAAPLIQNVIPPPSSGGLVRGAVETAAGTASWGLREPTGLVCVTAFVLAGLSGFVRVAESF